jgi:hypothetical protein
MARRKIGIILAVIAMLGCATTRDRWSQVRLGQSTRETVEVMGEPQEALTEPKSGERLYSWHLSETCDICEVVFTSAGIADAKSCRKDRGCQRAALMGMQMMLSNPPPAPTNQAPSPPVRTSCTSQNRFGTVYTDCESH